jgi:hypothetical protein
MIPQPTSTTPPQPAPRGAEWIDVAEAARRSGEDERTLRRWCAQRWMGLALAKFEPPADGGKSRFWVRSDADPRFARVQPAEHETFDLGRLSIENRRKLLERDQVRREWLAACAEGVKRGWTARVATSAYLAKLEADRGLRLSRRTLQLWQKAYNLSGVAGLVSQHWLGGAAADGGAGGTDGGESDPFLADVKRFYLTPRRRTKQTAWEMACLKASEAGRPSRSYRATCRHLDGLPRALLEKLRRGEDAYVAKCEPSIERDYSTLHTNEQWVGDHHQFDVMVNDGGRIVRPWLTAWMDMRSRRIVGWCMYGHAPNQNAILSALRAGCLDCGLPDLLYMDNGKDFDCYALHGRTKWERRRVRARVEEGPVGGILAGLGIKARFCWAYHGQSKPIERWFGTVEDRFGKGWDTYCGNKPENRPEDLQRQLDKGKAPTLAEFVGGFSAWLASDYHVGRHTGRRHGRAEPAGGVRRELERGRQARRPRRSCWTCCLMKTSRPVKRRQERGHVAGAAVRPVRSRPDASLAGQRSLPPHRRTRRHARPGLVAGRQADLRRAGKRARSRQRHRAAAPGRDRGRRSATGGRSASTTKADPPPARRPPGPDDPRRGRAARRPAAAATRLPTPEGPGSVLPIRSELEDQLGKLRESIDAEEQLRPAAGAECVRPLSFRELMAGVTGTTGRGAGR